MKNAIRSLELFKHLKEDTLKKLENISNTVSYKCGEHIFRDKEEIATIYVVCSGKVSLYKLSESAQKKIVFILGPNKIINDVILDGLKSSINCEVFEEATILCFNREKFIKVMEEDFELTKVILNSLAIKTRRMYRQIKNSTPIKVDKRVAAKLLKLSRDYGVENSDGILINLKISVTYLADLFGTPRETISRALKALQDKGLIQINNRQIIIKDREKLTKYFKE